mmetsp:Transcript_29662/g.73494  ORF Transcript_29662/g.73494 Transcript_29662/m.73494 type:complete len:237 (-) Transcript_29662:2039-2749(-)
MPHPQRGVARRPLQLLFGQGPLLLLLVLEGAVEYASEQASVDRALVHDNGILLVVSCVAHDADNNVDTGGQLTEVQVLHRASGHQRLLRVEQHVRQSVHAQLKVGHIHAHGLFTHGALVGVARGLVVVRERDDGPADAENHGRVDLTVRVHVLHVTLIPRHAPRLHQILDGHGNHRGLLLLGIHVLDAPVGHQVVPSVPRHVLFLQHLDVSFPDLEPLVLYDEQRPDAPPVVSVQP